MNYYQNIGEFVPDKLFAGDEIRVVTQGMDLAPSQGLLLRGTVLCRDDNGKYRKISEITDTPAGILTDSRDTEENTIASMYLTGMFNESALIFGEGVTIEDFRIEMRKLNLYTKTVAEGESA